MTAREMITISNGVNRNSDEEMIARIEKRIEENASKGKTYVSITKNKYDSDDYIVNVEFPYSYDDNYNNKVMKFSYAEIDNIPDFCAELAEDNLKLG